MLKLSKISFIILGLFLCLFSSDTYAAGAGVVFDFDGTITVKHSNIYKDPVDLIGTDKNKEAFKNIVLDLLDRNIPVFIASYGTKAVILDTMDYVFENENPFHEENIITPPDIDERWKEGHYPPKGFNKNNMLTLIKERFNISQLILFDDRPDNVKNVNFAQLEDYTAHLVKKGSGMQRLANDINEKISTFLATQTTDE